MTPSEQRAILAIADDIRRMPLVDRRNPHAPFEAREELADRLRVAVLGETRTDHHRGFARAPGPRR